MKHIFQNVQRVLAPLVGGSDLSYRLLCRKYGAQVTYTEMCIAEYYLSPTKGRKLKKYTFEFDPSDRPLILQLAGNTADPIIELANDPMFEGKIDGVDLNCGCPQGFALEKGYGCALLRNEKNLVEMCEKIVKNIKYPLSVKLRLHENVDRTIEIMHQLKRVGVAAFTVHGRFYWQKGEKRGKCDWDAIKKIRETFPEMIIIGNGDAYTFTDANDMISKTNVDVAMTGYGALLNPSIFSPNPVPLQTILYDYLTIARTHKGQLIDILRHVGWILKGHSLPLELHQKVLFYACKSLDEVCDFLRNLNCNITLPDIPAHEDKIIYPKSKGSQTNKERKREAWIELKNKQKRLKKEKYLNDPYFGKALEKEGTDNNEGKVHTTTNEEKPKEEKEGKVQKTDDNLAEKEDATSEESIKNSKNNAVEEKERKIHQKEDTTEEKAETTTSEESLKEEKVYCTSSTNQTNTS